MISKKLLFLIIVLLIVATVAGLCAAYPDVKSFVVGGLTGIGGVVWVSVSTGWSDLATTVGASGTYFLIYTCVTLLFGGILFVMLNRAKAAGKIPFAKKPTIAIPLQSGPDVVPGSVIKQTNPTPTQPEAPKELEAEAA